MVERLRASTYPEANRLLITADSRGSNGSRLRLRLWLWNGTRRPAAETGLSVTVRHRSPGTSKWNKVERRLFTAISRSWRVRPLTSHEVVIERSRLQRRPPY